MKQKFLKTKEILFLLVAVIIIGCMFNGMYFRNLKICVTHGETGNVPLKQDLGNGLLEDTDDTSRSIQYTDEGAYLIDGSGKKLSGPYNWLDESLGEPYAICRYMGDNELFGFISTIDGKRITPPMYINAFPFEFQGHYARVQMQDESWAIINKQGDILRNSDSFDSINALPSVTDLGSGIKNGHALLFRFSHENDNEIEVVREYNDFCGISEVYYGEFAVVQNEQKMYGVICGWNGKIIVPAVYTFIDWSRVPIAEDSENSYENITIFEAQKKDGTYDFIEWNPWNTNWEE